MDADELECRWFVRTKAGLAEIGEAFGDVRFVSIPGGDRAEYAFSTEKMSRRRLGEVSGGMELLAAYRILDE